MGLTSMVTMRRNKTTIGSPLTKDKGLGLA